jgi:hypothetical protein
MSRKTPILTALSGVVLAASILARPAAEAARVVRSGATSIQRPAARGAIGNGARVNRGAINSGNRINNGNVHVGNNNVNVNVNGDHGWDWDDHYHPVAAGVAFGAAAAVTRAAVGSMMYSLPPACSPYRGPYYYCGGVYYEPQYQGDKVVYVVVNQPP